MKNRDEIAYIVLFGMAAAVFFALAVYSIATGQFPTGNIHYPVTKRFTPELFYRNIGMDIFFGLICAGGSSRFLYLRIKKGKHDVIQQE